MIRKKLLSFAAASLLAVGFLLSQACATSGVVAALNAVVAAAQASIPILEVTNGLPVPVGNLISNYLTAVSSASAAAATELATADPTATKVKVISADFAQAIVPNLTGLPVQVIGSVKAVDAAVQAFLASIGAKPGAAANAIRANAVPAVIPLSRTDKTTLQKIQEQALTVAARAQALKK